MANGIATDATSARLWIAAIPRPGRPDSVNIVFLGGADFDTPPLLGSTDRSRYIKVKSLAELDEPDLRAWIENAAEVAGWS